VPIEVRRFGVGHRRPDGPAGTVGIEGQVIVSGASGVIAELAFGRRAHVTPHASPSTTYFLVIEGGGWVGVGEERTRVQAGEAVVWPPDILHAAWTEGAPMRAIVVELPPPILAIPEVLEGSSRTGLPLPSGRVAPEARGEGTLAPRPRAAVRGERGAGMEEGEPL
jgi:quercetin dioxygenase-like cupin family protein